MTTHESGVDAANRRSAPAVRELVAHGPLSWPGSPAAPSIFEHPIGRARGVYLWSVDQGADELVYYVGETGSSFAQRVGEHYVEHAAGSYAIDDPHRLRRGERARMWPGRYFRGEQPAPVEFPRRYAELAPMIAELIALYRFYVIPMDGPARERIRLEGAIARALIEAPAPVGSFPEPGIRYRPRRHHETAIECRLSGAGRPRGVPERLAL